MKILEKIKNIAYALPFGMKAGDELMTTSNKSVENGSSIQQKVEKKSVWNDLLNGEVTQEVEELRYEMFKAEELSNEYQYVGNGQARKKKGTDETIANKRKKFIQYNVDIEYSVKESMDLIEAYNEKGLESWKPRKVFKATYSNPFTRFRLENCVHHVKVDISEEPYKTYMYFIDDDLNRQVRPLVNLIKKTKADVERLKESGNDVQLRTYKEKSELFTELYTFGFTTLNATNDVPNGIDYHFKEPTLTDILEEDGYVVLVYSWKIFEGNVLLSERFKSKTAEEKFKNKEKRENYKPTLGINSKQEELVLREREDDVVEGWSEE
jgi:hypothetical protein